MGFKSCYTFGDKFVDVHLGSYSDCSDADIVDRASAKLDKGDTRLKLLEDNVNIFVPMIQKSLLMVSMVILYFHLIQSIL